MCSTRFSYKVILLQHFLVVGKQVVCKIKRWKHIF